MDPEAAQGITTKSKPETDQSDCTISSKQMFPYTCKTAQLVTNLQQTYTRFKDVIRMCLLGPRLFIGYKVVEVNRLVTNCFNNLLSSCNSTTC